MPERDLTPAELRELVAANNIEVIRDRARRAEAELARVRAERDRLAADAFERAEAVPDFGAWLEVEGIMTRGPMPDEDLAERLAEHDRRAAPEGERASER